MEPDRARRRSPAAGLPLLAAGLILLDGLADGFSIVPALGYQMARRDLDSFIVNSFALAGTYLLCVAAIAVVFSHASRLLRFTGYALTLFGLTLHLGLRATNGYGLRYHEGSMLASKSVPLAEALPGGVWPYISAAVLVAAILALYETLGRRKLAELRSRA